MFNHYLKTYFTTLLVIFALVGGLNLTIDPLWYNQGNRISGINPPWNERISKTNLFLQRRNQYNCLLFGTSRATLFHTTSFNDKRCFNYSFSGGKLEELANYAQYASQKTAEIQQKIEKVYVEIEPASLNRRSKPGSFEAVTDPMPLYQSYFFSLNAVWLSLKTLTNLYDYSRLYDRSFQVVLADKIPQYKPRFSVENENNQGCDFDRIQHYQKIKAAFPEARLVGFVAPVSAWRVYSSRYANDLLNCQVEGTYQIAQIFDAVYDFSLPSDRTTRKDNTYDGNHYYPEVYDQIADVMEGRRSDFGILVNTHAVADYQKLYNTQLKAFLNQVGESERWQG